MIARMDEYLDGEADADTPAEIEEHISSCDRCRRELEELKDIRYVIKETGVIPPPGLHNRIMMSVRAEAEASRRRRFVRTFSAVAAAVVLVAGIAWGSLMLGMSFSFRAESACPGVNNEHDASGGMANKVEDGEQYGIGAEDNAHSPDNDNADVANTPVTSSEPGSGEGESLYDPRFDVYGRGYDGGYVICAVDMGAGGLERLAERFGASLDGTAFTIPYSGDAMEKVTSLLTSEGIEYSSVHVGDDTGEQCIIVSVK